MVHGSSFLAGHAWIGHVWHRLALGSWVGIDSVVWAPGQSGKRAAALLTNLARMRPRTEKNPKKKKVQRMKKCKRPIYGFMCHVVFNIGVCCI